MVEETQSGHFTNLPAIYRPFQTASGLIILLAGILVLPWEVLWFLLFNVQNL